MLPRWRIIEFNTLEYVSIFIPSRALTHTHYHNFELKKGGLQKKKAGPQTTLQGPGSQAPVVIATERQASANKSSLMPS